MYLISCYRTEGRSWSPPILEDGKAQAYRINIEPEPQVREHQDGCAGCAGQQSWVWGSVLLGLWAEMAVWGWGRKQGRRGTGACLEQQGWGSGMELVVPSLQ